MSSSVPTRTTRSDGVGRFTGLLAAIVGITSTLLAVTVGTAAIAETEGVGRALWIVLSVATFTGQAAADAGAHQVTVMVLSVWMVCNEVTLAIAAIVLWRSTPRRSRSARSLSRPRTSSR